MASTLNKTYPVKVPAGASRLLESGGNYVYCESADLLQFEIAVDDVRQGVCGPGLGFETRPGEPDFTNVRVINKSASELNAVIVIGSGHVLDNRLVLAGVAQMEGAAAPTYPVGTNQFWGDGFASVNWNEGAVAGQLSHANYYNTPASGVVVEFTMIDVSSGSAGFELRRMTLLQGTQRVFQPNALRLAAAFATSVQLWTFTAAVAQGTRLYALPLTGGQLRHKPDTHILVPPGEGLTVVADTANQAINVKVQFREWPA